MPLVDYSSDSSVSASESGHSADARQKRQKTTHGEKQQEQQELPPLPSAFHDLYASTVRVSASDDPTLHQGRKRVNPHKVGNWPSHLYIEWHPTQSERATLTTFLSNLQQSLASSLSSPNPITITSFLTSDLGAPQPLHISLSRPIVLSTAQKAPFQSSLESRIRESGIAPFELATLGVEWHRTAESARSFLVLRVGSIAEHHRQQNKAKADKSATSETTTTINPQLTALLHRTNDVVTTFGQPALYAPTNNEGNDAERNTTADKAFHISIAWSFATPTTEIRRLTDTAFNEAGRDFHAASSAMRVRVDGIKAKIGNVVTHVPLPVARGRRAPIASEGGRGLFGL
ncbi:U6 snRNA phosphodiesterase Usb1 [Xylaria sp. CBS 124048]|nr:U6 snRNA phosphodiesterase Usb1 [Xylaria sp. CBS 124048]